MAYKMVLKHHFEDKKLKEFLKNLPEATMRVGWKKGQVEENGVSTAKVAYLNEVGHDIIRNGKIVGHVVPRPFMSLSAEMYQNSWKQAWRRLLRGYITGQYSSFKRIMHIFCTQYVIEDIRRLVTEEKPFAPNYRTNKKTGQREILKKTPLIDWGTMIATLTHEVEIHGKYKGK